MESHDKKLQSISMVVEIQYFRKLLTEDNIILKHHDISDFLYFKIGLLSLQYMPSDLRYAISHIPEVQQTD